LPRAIILAGGIAAALAIYFFISLYVLPESYQEATGQPRPEPVITGVSISSQQIVLGETLTLSVSGTNGGDTADMQIVSVGFPNVTAGSDVRVLEHDFAQTPFTVERGDGVGSGYTGTSAVVAQYPSIEAFSRPWDADASYTIDLEVTPANDGRFVVFVKSVAFPHSWDGAHYPRQGLVDYQQEFVESFSVQVTKS
jgi:hypothetical protein